MFILPIPGYMFDWTGNYDAAFHLGGAVLVVSGLLFCLLHLPYFQHANADDPVLEDQTIAEIPDDILLDNEFSDNLDSSELDKEIDDNVFTNDTKPQGGSQNNITDFAWRSRLYSQHVRYHLHRHVYFLHVFFTLRR